MQHGGASCRLFGRRVDVPGSTGISLAWPRPADGEVRRWSGDVGILDGEAFEFYRS